jgi:dimethylhistidine N-methyltransferase
MEFGAGAGEKIRILFDALESPRAYIPLDISDSSLGEAAQRLASDYPNVAIYPVSGDFASELRWPFSSPARRIGFFPGSTIGNFTPPEAREFLAATARLLHGGALLIGVDLVKDPAVLHAAYNDAAGVTAAFNRNLLVRANRELAANFEVMSFSHYAFYNPVEQRIEMHLISDVRQFVTVAGRSIQFAKGETLVTEYSYKYTVEQFQELAASAGFVPRALWCDSDGLFSIHWLETKAR